MVVLPYIGTMGKLKFKFSLSSTLIFINIKVESMLKANDIWKNLEKLLKQV